MIFFTCFNFPRFNSLLIVWGTTPNLLAICRLDIPSLCQAAIFPRSMAVRCWPFKRVVVEFEYVIVKISLLVGIGTLIIHDFSLWCFFIFQVANFIIKFAKNIWYSFEVRKITIFEAVATYLHKRWDRETKFSQCRMEVWRNWLVCTNRRIISLSLV